MWERLAAAISNAAAASRFRYILSDGNVGFEYNEIILIVKWMDSCQISLNVSNNMLIIEYTNCEMPIDTGIGNAHFGYEHPSWPEKFTRLGGAPSLIEKETNEHRTSNIE